MAMTLEYLARRCAINEAVLQDLGDVVAAQLPAMQEHLRQIGEGWGAAIDKLNTDFPDTFPPKGADHD